MLLSKYLVDGVVALNKVIDLSIKSMKACLVFKVNFEKGIWFG